MSGMSPQPGPAPRDPSSSPYGQGPSRTGAPYGVPDPAAQAPYGLPPADPAYGNPAGPGGPVAAPAPGWSAPPPAPLPRPVRPASIATATWLILAAGALTLVSVALGLLGLATPESRGQLSDMLRESYTQAGMPADQVSQTLSLLDSSFPVILGATAVVGLLVVLVYVLIALRIRGGSRTARTIGTVLAVLSVLSVVASLAMGAFDPLGVLTTVLGAAGIVMAHRKDATEFMRLTAWQQAARRR